MSTLRLFLPLLGLAVLALSAAPASAQCQACASSSTCKLSNTRAHCSPHCVFEYCSCGDGVCHREVEPYVLTPGVQEPKLAAAQEAWPLVGLRVTDCDGSSEVFAVFAGAAGVTFGWVPGLGRGAVPVELPLEGVAEIGGLARTSLE